MAVPNTNTFSQRDVVTEIYGDSSNRSLTELFSAANGIFDTNYVGSKNSLYNFRNYQHATYPYQISSYWNVTINGVFYTCYESRALAEQALHDYFYPAGRTVAIGGSFIYWNTPTLVVGSKCKDAYIDRWLIGTTYHHIYHIVNSTIVEVIFIV